MDAGVSTFAETATDGVLTALTSTFTSIANDAISALSSALPIVLPIMGIGIVAGVAIRFFKKFAK